MLNKTVGIYKITSPDNKVYIGQSHNIQKRLTNFRYVAKPSSKVDLSILKYGWNNHKSEIVHELPKNVNQEVLDTYEKLYIECYMDCGVELLNIKEGGKNGRHSEETKRKISLSELGKKVSEETRIKMRESLSLEHKIVMQEARKKVPPPFLGKHHSQESKDKISKIKVGWKGSQNIKVVCSKTGIIYDSMKDAAISIGMKPYTLRSQLSGNTINKTSFILFK